MTQGPLIVQSDKTLLLDIDHPLSAECRQAIAPFAELEKSPEHIHTYRLTSLGLWNARASGHDAEQVIDTLLKYSRYAVAHALLLDIADVMGRYGRLRIESHPVHGLVLISTDVAVLTEVMRAKKVAPLLGTKVDDETVTVISDYKSSDEEPTKESTTEPTEPVKVKRTRKPLDDSQREALLERLKMGRETARKNRANKKKLIVHSFTGIFEKSIYCASLQLAHHWLHGAPKCSYRRRLCWIL